MQHRSPVTVGRDADLAAAGRAVDAARAGRGGTLLVAGEAGIGKSRLLAETARLARGQGMTVLEGHAVQGGGAYRPVAEALLRGVRSAGVPDTPELRPYRGVLARLLPDLSAGAADAPEPGVDPAVVLGEAVLRLIAALGGPQGTVVVLEDLHWADPDTLALLDYVAGAVFDLPVLVVASARDDARTTARLDPLARRPGVTMLRLDRLAPADVAALAAALSPDDLPGEATLLGLIERSDGLPFLVEELLAALPDAPLPPSFAMLVAGRVAGLSDESRRLVSTAAVIGTDVGWDLIGEAAGLNPTTIADAARAAVEAHVLVSTEGRLTWRHALTREAVAALLLPPERTATARRVADLLLARGGPDDESHAADVLAAAGLDESAAGILVRLAQRDLARGALRSAGDLLDRAQSAGGAYRPAWTVARVRLLALVGDVPAALRIGESAVDRLTGDAHAELCLQLGSTAIVGGRWAVAQQYADRAGRPDDPRTSVILADAAYGAGDPRRAGVHAVKAIEDAERTGDGASLCAALIAQGRSLAHRDAAAADATFRRAVQTAAEKGLTPLRVSALIGLATGHADEEPVPAVLESARELAVEGGLLAQVTALDLLLADFHFAAFGPAASEPYARRAADGAARLRLSPSVALSSILVAACRAGLGDAEGAEAWLRRSAAQEHATVEARAGIPFARALLALVEGDLVTAERLATEAGTRLYAHPSASPLIYFGLWVVLRAVGGDGGAAAKAFSQLPQKRRRVNRASVGYALAVAAGRAKRRAEAAALFAEADAEFAGHDWWQRLLRMPVLSAALDDGWGDPVPLLRADLDFHEKYSAPQLARAYRDLLRRAGAPTRRGRGSSTVPQNLRAAGVTSREMDVLALVADGLGNAEIAERLYLSRRTVETHVAHLLTKTGARDRAGLRALVSR
jgi:DNA-binding CsgD family transcriptional regulator